jgi:outer membrane protein
MLTLLAGAMLSACAPVDRWEMFDVDWQKHFQEEQKRSVALPDDVKPKQAPPANAPALPDPGPDGKLALSLEQAVVFALRNNRDLAVEQVNPVIVGAFEGIERGVFDPELFGGGSFNEERALEVARSTGQQFSVKGRDTDANIGLRQKLPTGTTVEANIDQTRTISSRTPEQQEARLGLTVTQSLLQGFGPAVNLAHIRQAELDTTASFYELRGFTEALLAETETAYWNYVLARDEIAIFESSLQVARQQAKEVQQRIQVGVLPETEAAAALAEVARREQALIDARSDLEARKLRLLRQINPNPAGTLDAPLEATTSPRIEPAPITDTSERLALAEKIRPDLNEARVRLDQNRLETIVTRNGLLPKLDLFIAVGKTGFGDTFSSSFRNLDGDTYDFTAGVSFTHLLGDRAAHARDRIALASRRQAAAAVANLQQLVRLDVRLAINEVERARQQITASTTTRDLQEKTLEAERQRFNVGASTALLVAQAQRDLLAAQIAQVRSVVGYRIALVNLYLSEGSLLDRRGITVGRPPRDVGAKRQ